MKIIVRAKPNSKEEKIEKVEEEHFVVSVKEPPINGLANRAIIKVLAEYFGVSKSNIRIVSGWNSRQKVVKII